jgi:hypothetical protein
MANKRISVTQENTTGRNTWFRDNRTAEIMSRADLVHRIEKGQYLHYHIRVTNGVKTPVSDPDGSENNNLDS